MSENTVVNGIVISSMPIGEYDRRLELLTDEFGRISAFARGARRPSSALVSCSRVFAFGKFSLFEGRTSYSINSAEISNFFERLCQDFETACYGSYFLELARYFTRENLKAAKELKLLYYSLRALELESLDNRLVKAVYELKMLQINGIYKAPDISGINKACAYTFGFVTETPVEKVYTFRLENAVLEEFSGLVSNLVEQATDVHFKSLELLEDTGRFC